MTAKEELQRHGVERVILLDSYLEKIRTEITLDGHTAITGANSSGKTSLIRLLPAFFGAEHRALVKPSTSKHRQTFLEYYLPRTGSYVVFEYRTQEGLNLAVFTSHRDTARPRILLISGRYDDDLFLDAQNQFLPKEGLKGRAEANGRTVHVCQTIAEYRRLVFGNARNRGRAYDTRRFNVLVGYPDHARRSLDGVHAILVSTLDNSVDAKLLRRLLYTQALAEAGLDQDLLTRININVEDLESWRGNYRGLAEMREQAGTARALIEQAEELKALGYEEAVLRAAAERRRQHIQQSLTTQERLLEGYEEERKALAKELADRTATYNAELFAHDGQARDAENELASIVRQRNKLIDEGADQALPVAELLDERAEDLRQAQARARVLSSASAEIDREVDEAIERIQQNWLEQTKKVDEELRALSEKKEQERLRLAGSQRSQREALEQTLTEQGTHLHQAELGASQAFTKAEEAVKNAQADAELIERLEQCRSEKDNAQEALQEATALEYQAKEASERALERYEARRRELGQAKERKSELEARQLSLTDLLARKGTLLEFVREHIPDWQQSLAATLSAGTDLLYQSHLSPELAEHPAESLFGVRIDTSKLTAVDVDEDEHERLAEVVAALEEVEKALPGLEAALAEAKRELRGQRTAYEAQMQARERLERRLTGAKQALEQAQTDARASQQQNAHALQAALERAGRALTDAQTERKKHAPHRKQQLEALEGEQAREQDELANEHSRAEQSLHARKESAEAQRKSLTEEWEETRRLKRQKQGVDEASLQKAEAAVETAERQLAESQTAQQLAQRWQDHLEDAAARTPGLKRQLAEARRVLEQMETAWNTFKATHQARSDALTEQTEAALSRQSELRTADGLITRILQAAEWLGYPGQLDEATVNSKALVDAALLAGENEDLAQQIQSKLESLRKRLGLFEKLFNRSASEMCRTFASSHNFSNRAGSLDPRELVEAADVLKAFYGEPSSWPSPFTRFPSGAYGENIESSIRTRIRANKLELHGFVEGLHKLRSEVGRQIRGIREHYGGMTEHLDSVEYIKVSAAMDLKKVDGYRAAQQAYEALVRLDERRESTGDEELLPGEDVVKAIELLIDYLSNRRHKQVIELVDAVEMSFEVKIDSDAQPKICRHGDSLKEDFSTGLGMLVPIIVLVGFLENMRRHLPIAVPWMLDELLALDEANARGILHAMAQHEIYLVTTSPSVGAELDTCFSRRYALQSVSENGKRLPSPIFVEQPTAAPEEDPLDLLDEDDDDDEGVLAASEQHAEEVSEDEQ